MNTLSRLEVEWLVASLSPWSISPHPNFREDGVTGAARLALVAEMNDRPSRDITHLGEKELSGWGQVLVSSARDSLSAETQAASVDRLLDLSRAQAVPPGARAAAVLFGSVALCELERHGEAVDALVAVLQELWVSGSNLPEFSASNRLIMAALSVQLSARLIESCRFDEARDRVEETLEWLPTLKDSRLEQFEVSSGISWSSSRVQRDLIRSISNHALSLKSYLEQYGGHTWVRVVRGRTSWVDMKMQFRSADRDEIVLRDAYERRVEADSNAQHFGRVTADGAGYRSLTVAELSGHLGFMRAEREKLGKVLILERGDSSERIREGLRLLRQGRATKALQAATQWIRAQGPTVSLVDDALIVTSRINTFGWCTEQDLLVLEGASDFLSPQQKDEAISAALVFAETPQLQHQLSWSSWERLWKTVARLIPASSRHSEIAALALDYVNDQKSISQPLTNTLARLIAALDWGLVSPNLVDRWADITRTLARNFDTSVLLDAIHENVLGVFRPIPSELSLDRAAHFADHGNPDVSDTDSVPTLAKFLCEALQKEVEDASKGVMHGGGYQTANIAVAFVLRFANDSLWDAIVVHLLDSNVDIGLKDRAVERLAENVAHLPSKVVGELRKGIRLLQASERISGMFAQSSSPVFGEALRLSAALGATSSSVLLETILRLATGEVKERIEAAKTIPLSIAGADSTWGHVLLLQLSHDPDPSVRAAAGHGLVKVVGVSSALTDAVYERIVELLKSDGIKVPLAVLHSIQRSARTLSKELRRVIPQIEFLTFNGNYVTQGAAKICLEMLRNPDVDA